MPLPYTHFVKTSTIVGAPTDTTSGNAPGKDPLGCNLSNATYDHTGGASGERQLTAASGTPFSSVQAADLIYLNNAAGGVADGLYEVASVPSSTVILLTADSGLTADSTADVDSSAGPWATIQYGLDNCTAGGDDLVIADDGDESDGTWTPGATLDADIGAGSDQEPITVRGGNSRGVPDGTVPTISGAGMAASSQVLTVSNSTTKRRWIDLRFTAGKDFGIYCADANSVDHQWLRCRFDNAAKGGVGRNPADWYFVDCEFADNGTWGIIPANASTLDVRSGFLRCRFHDNGTGGIYCTGFMFVSQCLFYDHGKWHIRFRQRAPNVVIDGCVFHKTAAGEDGINCWGTFDGMSPFIVTNSIFRTSAGYGIDMTGFAEPGGVPGIYWAELDYNCWSNNTSGDVNGATKQDVMGSPAGDTNVYADPTFTSETDGSEDFDLQSTSPCIDAGLQVPER